MPTKPVFNPTPPTVLHPTLTTTTATAEPILTAVHRIPRTGPVLTNPGGPIIGVSALTISCGARTECSGFLSPMRGPCPTALDVSTTSRVVPSTGRPTRAP